MVSHRTHGDLNQEFYRQCGKESCPGNTVCAGWFIKSGPGPDACGL
jgi:hypothetical protein